MPTWNCKKCQKVVRLIHDIPKMQCMHCGGIMDPVDD